MQGESRKTETFFLKGQNQYITCHLKGKANWFESKICLSNLSHFVDTSKLTIFFCCLYILMILGPLLYFYCPFEEMMIKEDVISLG